MIKLYVEKDYAAVSQRAFEEVKDVLAQPSAVLGLATGSSPVGLYQRLVQAYKDGRLSFKNAVSFNLDEYVGIAPDHPESYHRFMYEHLFNHVDMPSESIHIPSGLGDVQANTERFAQLLAQHPQDVQVLGVGSNGHIGFNEPGCDFDSVVHIETLNPQTIADNARFFGGDQNLVPKQAITMGIQDILRAKKIVLIVSGDQKAKVVHALFNAPISNEIPCTILQTHPNVVVIVDEPAASELKHD